MRGPKRFWSKVDIQSPDDCWEWQAGKTGRGYGAFKIHGTQHSAHRVSWYLANGPIPEGAVIRHTCDNEACVNPQHLLAGTHSDNRQDAVRRGQIATKLTPKEVKEIREVYAKGNIDQESLGLRYGVAGGTIADIVTGRTWEWLQ